LCAIFVYVPHSSILYVAIMYTQGTRARALTHCANEAFFCVSVLLNDDMRVGAFGNGPLLSMLAHAYSEALCVQLQGLRYARG
jgi:hypothetical protein